MDLHRSVIIYFSQQPHHRSTVAVMHVPVITQFCAPPLRCTFILASSVVPMSSSLVGSRMFSAAQVIGACKKWAHCKDLPLKDHLYFCGVFLPLCVASTPSYNSCWEDSNSHFQDYVLFIMLMIKMPQRCVISQNDELMLYIPEVHVQLQSDISVLPEHSCRLFLPPPPASQEHAGRLLKYFTCSTVSQTDTKFRQPPRPHK